MTTLLAVIFVFGLLILGHEFGHFMLAKLTGIKVNEFSFGMGPRLLKFGKGETEYSWRIFPIGGFVKMLGEDEQVDNPKSFSSKSTPARISVIAAGPVMNIIIPIIIFAGIAMFSGYAKPVVKDYAKPLSGSNITYPAKGAGIMAGDRITHVNGKKILVYDDFRMFMYQNKGKPFDVTVNRGGKSVNLHIVPVFDKNYDSYMVGIEPYFGRASLPEGIQYGYLNTVSIIKQMGGYLKGVVMGKASVNDISGPVGIIKYTGEAAKAGFSTLLFFTALLSINLAIINLIPFPALDGGWLIILIIEGITRKKLDADKVGIANFVGFAFLMVLTILITFKDIFKFSGF
ncbi:MAG TPA: RIP metalloprotease RseP [Clostridiaceae bacterium]|nr:RIP metalloprotease RseP [Clostridiaceae bacterium]